MARRLKNALYRALCGHQPSQPSSSTQDGLPSKNGKDPNSEVFAEHPAVRPLSAAPAPQRNPHQSIPAPATPPKYAGDGPSRPSREDPFTSVRSSNSGHGSRHTFERWDTPIDSNEPGESNHIWDDTPKPDQSEQATAKDGTRGRIDPSDSTPRLPEPEIPNLELNLDSPPNRSEVTVDHTAHPRSAVTHEEIRPHVHTVYHPVRTRSIHIHEHRKVIQPIIVPNTSTQSEIDPAHIQPTHKDYITTSRGDI